MAGLPFSQEIVIRGFRLPIRLAYSLGQPSLKELQTLMKTALVQELQAQGQSIRRIAVTLDVTENWASQLVKKANLPGDGSQDMHLLRRFIERLQQRPASASELAELIPMGASFPMDRVALALLLDSGIAEIMPGCQLSYRLTEQYTHLSHEEWRRPLDQLERRQLVATDVMMALHNHGPLASQALLSVLKLARVPVQALEMLRDQGIVTDQEGRWALVGNHLCLLPRNRGERLRTGLMGMLDAIGKGMGQLLNAQEEVPFGQRTLHFKIRARDLRPFIMRHHRQVMEELGRLDALAEKEPASVDCSMVWLIVPNGTFPQEESDITG